jgi:hypothetical protein
MAEQYRELRFRIDHRCRRSSDRNENSVAIATFVMFTVSSVTMTTGDNVGGCSDTTSGPR